MSGIRRSAALAAALSFILPGLGQGVSGAMVRGFLLASPIAVLLVGAFLLLGEGSLRVAGVLIQPPVIIGLLVLDGALLVYRVAAIVDAYLVNRRLHPVDGVRSRRIASLAVLAALLIATVSMHAALGVVGMKTYSAVTRIFSSSGPTGGLGLLPGGQPGLGHPDPAGTSAPTPRPLPAWQTDGRLNLLLVGGDAGPGRWSLRTDTMILLSVDIATGKAAMFGIPRNLVNVPLPPESAPAFRCGCFPDLLNGLFVYAGQHPDLFPGGSARGYLALQGAVAALTGVELDGMLVVDLNGFVRLVDALGGIDIYVPAPVYDAQYPLENGLGDVAIYIGAGQQHMNGHVALEYARSRHGSDDYNRMGRQQSVLLALRRAVDPCKIVTRLPELIDIAGDSMWTNLPIAEVPGILGLAARVNASKVGRYAFAPPTIPEYLSPRAVASVQAMVAGAFLPPSSVPARSPGASVAPTTRPTTEAGAGGGC